MGLVWSIKLWSSKELESPKREDCIYSMVKKKFQVEGMHCTSCALLIDEDLEEIKGVKQSKTSYAKQVTEVVYDESCVNEALIVTAIGQAGYRAIPNSMV